MKRKLLALLISLSMALGMLPSTAFADPSNGAEESSPDNPLVVPEEGLIVSGTTVKGIDEEWLEQNEPQDGSKLFLKVTIPETATQIGDGYSGFRLSSSKYSLELDFSQARNLGTINKQAAMYGTALTGVLDLSATKIKTIGVNAFNGCTGLTGVILPSTLEILGSSDGTSGSVFKDCTNLKFVRSADENGTPPPFELPSGLKVLGKDSFNGCTGLPENTVVTIPESVERVGSQAFYNTPQVTTIYVMNANPGNYHGAAFKSVSGNHGVGKRLIVFTSPEAKNAFKPEGFNEYKNACTYEFTLHFGNGVDSYSEKKLWGQQAKVCKRDDGSWYVNGSYSIPDDPQWNSPAGYSGGWDYENAPLTANTVLKPSGDDLWLAWKSLLQNPHIEFVVNGEGLGEDVTSPELRVPAGSEVGVKVTHEIWNDPNANTEVKFEYAWTDVWDNGSQGPRMQEDGFGRYNEQNNPSVGASIEIRGQEDERTSAGSYTGEDYGDGYYLVEIYGYSKPREGGEWTLFYKSHSTAISPDPESTVNTAYTFKVTIENPITITPADITVYTGGEGYTGIVDAGGNATTAQNGLPEPGYYITLPDWLNDQLGGDANAENLSDILTFEYDDGNGTERTWELELYGTEEHSSNVEGVDRSRYIYRLSPGIDENDNEIPVRLKLTDSEGNVVTSDEFTPSKDQQYARYDMSIYSGDLDPSKITAKLELTGGTTVSCGVESGEGRLTVRGLTDGNITSEILASESGVSGDKIAAVAPEGTTFFVNGSNVELNDAEGVRLLADDLLDEQTLVDYIKNSMSEEDFSSEGYSYEQKYLDLVDSKNGNAFLTMGDGQMMDVYWPVPDDFDDGGTFYVIHFAALDRNYDDLEEQLANHAPKVIDSKLVTVNGTQYVKFSTGSFSPFILAYNQKSGGGSGTTNYTLNYDTNGGDPIEPETRTNPWTKSYSELPTPVWDGHSFEGWYFDSGLTDPVEGDVAVDRSSVTLHAGWKLDPTDPDNNGVSGWLETEEHFPFMSGYPDGSFGPDSPITRAEIAQVFYNLLKDKDVEVTAGFSDVPEGSWYEDAVSTLASLGLLEGVGGGLYDPDRNLTRAELAAIATRFANGSGEGSSASFPDVSEGDWFAGAVSEAAGYGWIAGYPDGTFGPYREVTRAEAAAIVNRMLGRQADEAYVGANADRLRSFPDVPEGHWAYLTVMEASNWHKYSKAPAGETWRAADVSDWLETSEHDAYMAGYPDGTFGPDDSMTRAEAAQTFYNLLLRNDVGPEVSFPDVPQDAWYAEAVSRLAGMGMVKGFDDGTFRPDEKITRAEFAAIASRFKDGDPSSELFPDVSEGDWFAGAVSEAAGYGWIAGYPDGTFGPYREVTRAEAAAIVNRMLGRQADEAYVGANADRLRSFPDVPEGHWAYLTVMEATNSHEHASADGQEHWTGLK